MLAIYYIATNSYCIFFKDFLDSLQYFFPQKEKHIILISDSLEEYDNYCNKETKITIEWHYLRDYPWPIITLFKFDYIKEYLVKDAEYHFYFNANAIVNKNYNQDYSWFKQDKLLGAIHQPSLNTGYANTYIQACFFGANTEMMIEICDYVSSIVNNYLKHNQIPPQHDETCFNMWAYKNRDRVNYQKIHAIEKVQPKDTELVYLRDKDSFAEYKNIKK